MWVGAAVRVLLVGVWLLGDPMSTVYSQNWSAGNSTFTASNTYTRATDGPDALYPEIEYAETVTVSGGKLDWNGVNNYQTSGLMLKDFPTFDGTVGSIQATYRPNSTSMGVTYFAPLIYVISSTGGGGERVIQLAASAVTGPGAPFTLDFTAFGWGASNYTANNPFTFAADTDYVVKVCWKTGTVTGDFVDVAADGYVRVYINDVLVYEVVDFAFYIDYLNTNHVTKVAFGQDTDNDDGAGLFGALSNIAFSDSACASSVTVVDNTNVCCSTGAGGTVVPSGGGQGAGATPLQTATIGTQIACAGSGTVPTAADLTFAESWWGA